MLHKVLILSLGIYSLVSCTSQKNVNAYGKESEGIDLFEGQQKLLKEYPLQIKFNRIVEESRCPEGVDCIWAGVAVAEIEITRKAAKPVILNLATTDMQTRGYQKSTNFSGYTIELQNVAPYPTTERRAQDLKGNYKISISVQKSKINDV
ncbi:hypothetical protein OHD16_20280 [Sphingobacterium sp. ML3W]|uniref:hypothetical protein n=1 Tax=Sphingobacterium sp. ML3W TaxID=1538644 RepID=UPI00249BFA60|nr:hypothetical protein [Sphingobacterium sp. ML3W]WFA82299.1 hypothetical protein OGI71_13420 [Sphingobacterium sp. ML3W]